MVIIIILIMIIIIKVIIIIIIIIIIITNKQTNKHPGPYTIHVTWSAISVVDARSFFGYRVLYFPVSNPRQLRDIIVSRNDIYNNFIIIIIIIIIIITIITIIIIKVIL